MKTSSGSLAKHVNEYDNDHVKLPKAKLTTTGTNVTKPLSNITKTKTYSDIVKTCTIPTSDCAPPTSDQYPVTLSGSTTIKSVFSKNNMYQKKSYADVVKISCATRSSSHALSPCPCSPISGLAAHDDDVKEPVQADNEKDCQAQPFVDCQLCPSMAVLGTIFEIPSHLFQLDPPRRSMSGQMNILKLQEVGRYIYRVTGDGNCLFRAFSKFLFGHENFHPQIRNAVVDFMEDNHDTFNTVPGPNPLCHRGGHC